MIVGLMRHSSEKQLDAHTQEFHRQRLKDAGCDTILEEVVSGYDRDVKRPAFDELVDLVKSGKVTKVIFDSFSRLGRNEARSFAFFDLCEDKGVEIVSLEEGFNPHDPDGRIMAGFSVIQARAYSAQLSRKIKKGQEARRKNKLPLAAPFGYVRHKDPLTGHETLEPDLRECLCIVDDPEHKTWTFWDVARYRIDAFFETGSVNKTLKKYNKFFGIFFKSDRGIGNHKPKGLISITVSGLSVWLCNPALRGHLAYGRKNKSAIAHESDWEYAEYNIYTALISEKEWQFIKDYLISNNKKMKGKFELNGNRPFAGIVYCAECSSPMKPRFSRLTSDKTIKRHAYQCFKYSEQKACTQKTWIREEKVHQAAIAALVSQAEKIANDVIGQETPPSENEISLQSQIDQLKAIPNAAPAIKGAIQALEQQLSQFKNKASIESSSHMDKRQSIIESFSDPRFWEFFVEPKLTPLERRSQYRQWIDRIWVRDGQIVKIDLNE